MPDKLSKWLPIIKEVSLVLLAIFSLYVGLRADTQANAASLDKQIALQALTDSMQTQRIEKLERIAERQDELIRSLDRLVARLDATARADMKE